MAGKPIDITGQKFGRLTVIQILPERRHGAAVWLCQCECGSEVKTKGASLRSGETQSCGCYNKDRTKEAHTKHGHVRGNHQSAAYKAFYNMHSRCDNPNHPSYKDYGGRGIKICARWASFENFLEDMGEPPKGLTLERVDNSAGYSPKNCRWASYTEQARNKRCTKLSVDDIPTIRVCLNEGMHPRKVAEEFGVHETLIYNIRAGAKWASA